MSTWDGAEKYLTKDCKGCCYFVHGEDANILITGVKFPKANRPLAYNKRRFCAWGVALKTLVKREGGWKHCEYVKKDSPGYETWRKIIAAQRL